MAVILAAGEATRFGSPKQLASYHGKTLLEHAVAKLQALANVEPYVVLGAYHEVIREQVPLTGVNCLINTDWQEGIGASIRAAARYALGRYEAILLLAVDQPMVSVASLNALIRRWQQGPANMVASGYAGTLGIPAIFPVSYFSSLAALQGDKGAKSILLQHSQCVAVVDVTEAAIDIDTTADLANL